MLCPWYIRNAQSLFHKFQSKGVEDIDFFEWILLLEIQTNGKNWVWEEKLVEPSMCSHCQI
jgi:hypothetical protein